MPEQSAPRLRTWLSTREREVLGCLIAAGVMLRVLLVKFSPTPFGYVWDFYYGGVRILYGTHQLPGSQDCWQCYHPPLFYLLGLPFYAFGRWMAAGPNDAMGLRWLGGLSLVCGAITIYYGDRLLRLFRCRRASRIAGFALLMVFPCLFISSYGPEADIVVTAILTALLYYLTDYFTHASSRTALDAVRLGMLTGLAAATKYTGLIGLVSVLIVIAIRSLTGPKRARALRDIAIVTILSVLLGGWKYLDNFRQFGTPFYANGSAAQGFSRGRAIFLKRYEFLTLRISDLMEVVGPSAPPGMLTRTRVYRSVFTTLHGLAWSDMSFFSDSSRHGDPSRPYPDKRTVPILTRTVLLLGFVPEVLAIVGVVVTLRRRIFLPVAILCVVTISVYVPWFLTQENWGLKTKYILFLLAPFVLYTIAGLGWITRRAPRELGAASGVLLVTLDLLAHLYLFVFSVG